MAIKAIEYRCLVCGGQYLTNAHKCALNATKGICTPEGHVGHCQKCTMLVLRHFERQFLTILLPKRLRIEGET